MSGRGTRVVGAVWAAVATPVLPAWAVITAGHPRWRVDWRGRWGVDVPPVQVGSTWIHAASVGEVGAAEALAAALDGPILLTADTDTGVERARQAAVRLGSRVVAAPRPVDHPWTLAPLWAEARPGRIVFVESAWWPQLAARAARFGVPVARVSAKAGPGTRRLGATVSRMWTDVTEVVICRDAGEAAFLGGVVGGDLKLAAPAPPAAFRWDRRYVVGASTRPGDEQALLDAVDGPLLLAPRHPERFHAVATLLEESGRRWLRRSAVAGAVPGDVDIVLLDTIGELASMLPGATAVFVGGTFDVGVGGHSPAEAIAAGVPVVSGPEVAANRGAFEAAPAWRQVARPDELTDALRPGPSAAPPRRSRVARRTAALLPAPRVAPEAPPRPWAAAVGRALSAGATARNRAYDLGLRQSHRVGVPVVSVGSCNARGAGKTSTALWVARSLADRGHTVGVAVRGYRRPEGTGVVVASEPDYRRLGDEGALFAMAGFTVAAGADRVAGARALVEAGATVIVLDDGLQHRRLHRDVDLVVVDARHPAGRGPLPAGEERERGPVPRRATGVVAHFGAFEADVPVAVALRHPGPWLRDGRLSDPPPGPVAGFAGLARCSEFRAGIDRPIGRFKVLADHAVLDPATLAELDAFAGGLPLVCTDKDAVRLPAEVRSEVWYRGIELEISGAPEAWFPAVR